MDTPALTLLSASALFLAGGLAGIANSIAGGGTFFSLPVFMSVARTAWRCGPHALASYEYRRDLNAVAGNLKLVMLTAAIGGAVGDMEHQRGSWQWMSQQGDAAARRP